MALDNVPKICRCCILSKVLKLAKQVWQVFVGTKRRRISGHYEALLTLLGDGGGDSDGVGGLYKGESNNYSLSEAGIFEKWTNQIEKVICNCPWCFSPCFFAVNCNCMLDLNMDLIGLAKDLSWPSSFGCRWQERTSALAHSICSSQS